MVPVNLSRLKSSFNGWFEFTNGCNAQCQPSPCQTVTWLVVMLMAAVFVGSRSFTPTLGFADEAKAKAEEAKKKLRQKNL